MGKNFSFLKKKDKFLGDAFEIKNGIVGVNRDLMFQLIKLFFFKKDRSVQNLIGISGECVSWLNHPHYPFCRNPKPNLKKLIIPNPKFGEKSIKINNNTDMVFELNEIDECGSIFLNVFVKEMILECTFTIEFKKDTWMYVGISTTSQLNQSMNLLLGYSGCGASLYLDPFSSRIFCNGNGSSYLKEGKIRNGENIVVIIDQKNKNNSKNGGKTNFLRHGKKIPHTITNIPSSGVYFGFSNYKSSFTIHVSSLRKLRVPLFLLSSSTTRTTESITTPTTPTDEDGVGVMMRCVAYDFNGFQTFNYNQRDENGEEIPNIKEYYA